MFDRRIDTVHMPFQTIRYRVQVPYGQSSKAEAFEGYQFQRWRCKKLTGTARQTRSSISPSPSQL